MTTGLDDVFVDRAESGVGTYECAVCGWIRSVSLNVRDQVRVYVHAAYGTVTVLEAAQNDVRFHDCELHAASRAKARESVKVWDRDYSPYRNRWNEVAA